jgi:hypothetical protein
MFTKKRIHIFLFALVLLLYVITIKPIMSNETIPETKFIHCHNLTPAIYSKLNTLSYIGIPLDHI